MVIRLIKYSAITVVGLGLVAGLLLGGDLISYARSGARSIQSTVKDSIPIDVELRRARVMVEDIIPELQANIRLIAQEEVEIAALETDIEQSEQRIADERQRIARVRAQLDVVQARYDFGDRSYSRAQVAEELSRRFERFKEAEVILSGKHRLLETRRGSLDAAVQMLDRTRGQKSELEQQIESLAGKYRLVQAASSGPAVHVDGSKLAESRKLIDQIRKRLNVAERVLAHQTRFVQTIPIDVLDEKDLLVEVDEYFEHGASTHDDELALRPDAVQTAPALPVVPVQ
ncbi:MAG: signal peptide-containing protein [Phycisphaeraceae bacterium]|nr:signal peptide-containing protein [Phycisphaeraceae bacterium]